MDKLLHENESLRIENNNISILQEENKDLRLKLVRGNGNERIVTITNEMISLREQLERSNMVNKILQDKIQNTIPQNSNNDEESVDAAFQSVCYPFFLNVIFNYYILDS